MKKHNFKLFVGLFLLVFLLSSCGSKRSAMYNPAEVAYLSEQLKIPISNNDPQMNLLAESSLWLGTPYRYGGTTKRGTDCSGFVGQVFYRVYGKTLGRSADEQASKSTHKVSKGKLKTGDLVFFSTGRKSKKINHVGIYLRNGYFIHASTSSGVIVSHLDEKYYKQAWRKGGRVK